MIDRRKRTWMPSAGRSSCFFFLFSTSSSNNFRFAFLALKVASQTFTWKISICSAKSITFSAAHLAESSLRRELARGPLFQVLHGSCSWLNWKCSAFPSAGFVRRLERLSLKVRLGPQSYPIWLTRSKPSTWKHFCKNLLLQQLFSSWWPYQRIALYCFPLLWKEDVLVASKNIHELTSCWTLCSILGNILVWLSMVAGNKNINRNAKPIGNVFRNLGAETYMYVASSLEKSCQKIQFLQKAFPCEKFIYEVWKYRKEKHWKCFLRSWAMIIF